VLAGRLPLIVGLVAGVVSPVWPNTRRKDWRTSSLARILTLESDVGMEHEGRSSQSLRSQFLTIFHSFRRPLGHQTVEFSAARKLHSARSDSYCFIPVWCLYHSHFLGNHVCFPWNFVDFPSRRYSWPFYSCAAGRRRMKMHYFALVRHTQDGWGHMPSLHGAPAWSIELNFTSLTYASASESSPSFSQPCRAHWPADRIFSPRRALSDIYAKSAATGARACAGFWLETGYLSAAELHIFCTKWNLTSKTHPLGSQEKPIVSESSSSSSFIAFCFAQNSITERK